MEYLPVRTKSDFSRRYRAGEFGNAAPGWDTVDEFLAYGRREFGTGPANGIYHLRNRLTAGGVGYYHLSWSAAVARWLEQKDRGGWYCAEQVPEEVQRTLTLQGEVQQAIPGTGRIGLELYYSTVPKVMREALHERAEQTHGLKALGLLRAALCPNSYEWLLELLDRYPGHVVEFSTFRKCWGTLFPRYNTIFWEVRLY